MRNNFIKSGLLSIVLASCTPNSQCPEIGPYRNACDNVVYHVLPSRRILAETPNPTLPVISKPEIKPPSKMPSAPPFTANGIIFDVITNINGLKLNVAEYGVDGVFRTKENPDQLYIPITLNGRYAGTLGFHISEIETFLASKGHLNHDEVMKRFSPVRELDITLAIMAEQGGQPVKFGGNFAYNLNTP
jgi:hypothetical protein